MSFRLWVGRRKEPILGYVPKNEEKNNLVHKGLINWFLMKKSDLCLSHECITDVEEKFVHLFMWVWKNYFMKNIWIDCFYCTIIECFRDIFEDNVFILR